MPIQIPKWWIPIDWTTHMRKGFRATEFFCRTSDAIQITEHFVCYVHITRLGKYWGGSFFKNIRIEKKVETSNLSCECVNCNDFGRFYTF